MNHFLGASCLAASLVGLGTGAWAAETKSVGVWVLGEKSLPKEARAKVSEEIQGVVKDGSGYEVVAVKKPQQGKLAQLGKKCKPLGSAACAVKAGAILKASHVLVAVFSGKGPKVKAQLSLVAVSGAREIGQASGDLSSANWQDTLSPLVRQAMGTSQPAVATAPEPPMTPAPPVAVAPAPTPPAETPPEPPLAVIAATTPAGPAAPAAPGEGSQDLARQSPPQEQTPAPRSSVIVAAPAEQITEPGPATSARALEATNARDEKSTFAVGLHLDLLVPSGRAGEVKFNDNLKPEAGRTATFAVMLEGRTFFLPRPVEDLGLMLEVGWYRLGREGERENANDPDFGSFAFAWTIQTLPVFVGPVYRLRLPIPFVEIAGMAGFAYQYVWATTSYTANGVTTTDATQTDSGFGYYAGVEAALSLGPGAVAVAWRYTSIRTDLKFKSVYDGTYNQDLGDLGGTSLLVGYRFEF